MIKKESLLNNHKEIVNAFGSQDYFGKVHTLETRSEGLCTFYYAELNSPYPNDKVMQFAILWKLVEMNEMQHDYRGKDQITQQKMLAEAYQYIIDDWEPRLLEKKDLSRAKEIIIECQNSSVADASVKSWMTRRKAGYYVNNQFQAKQFSPELMKKITAPNNTGWVIYDNWDLFTLLIESKSALSMAYWVTYA